MQAFKVCPRCQTPADLNARVCVNCGREYRTQFVPPEQTQVITPMPPSQYPPYPPQYPQQPPDWVQNPSHPLVIGLMWFFTVASALSAMSNMTVCLILDGVAVACAVALLMSKNKTDKRNAYAKLIWEGIWMVIGFAIAVSHSAASRPPDW